LEVGFRPRRDHGPNHVSAVVKEAQIDRHTLVLVVVIKVKAHAQSLQ
jgi:hypothetical protein